MRKALEIGGVIAALVLIAFGIVSIVMGANGRDTVGTSWNGRTSSARPT